VRSHWDGGRSAAAVAAIPEASQAVTVQPSAATPDDVVMPAAPVTTAFETVSAPAPPPRSYKALLQAGILCLLVFAGLSYKVVSDSKGYQHVQGTVVNLAAGSAGGTRPEIEYEVGEQKYTTLGHESGFFVKGYAVGDTVMVNYNSLNPGEGRLYCLEDEWFWPFLAGAIGLGLLMTWRFMRKRPAYR
jgi:hypothetical protein